MAGLYEIASKLSKALPFLNDIDALKREADSYKPLPKETEDRILQKFRLEWNYHSNAIEGNKLTYGETVAFIMEGLTAKGKPLKDHLDIQGHDEAVKYLTSLVKLEGYILTEVDIRDLHKMILKESYWADAITADGSPTKKEIKVGQYKSSSNSVKTPTGEMHYYATLEDTPIKMGELMEFYKEAKANNAIHPLVLAALFHHEFVAIHPFDDGNGRMGRLLMNLMLMQYGYPPVVVKQEDRQQYYQVLRQADVGEYIPIVEYMSSLLQHSLDIYINGAKGESIQEESDIDKEIALFKKGLGEKQFIESRTEVSTRHALSKIIIPLLAKFRSKLKNFEDVFLEVIEKIDVAKIKDTQKTIIQYSNIDEFIKYHEKTQLYVMESFLYEFNMKTFQNSNKPFDTKFSLYVYCDNALITLLITPGTSVKLKYNEELTEANQQELVSQSILLLIDKLKRFSSHE